MISTVPPITDRTDISGLEVRTVEGSPKLLPLKPNLEISKELSTYRGTVVNIAELDKVFWQRNFAKNYQKIVEGILDAEIKQRDPKEAPLHYDLRKKEDQDQGTTTYGLYDTYSAKLSYKPKKGKRPMVPNLYDIRYTYDHKTGDISRAYYIGDELARHNRVAVYDRESDAFIEGFPKKPDKGFIPEIDLSREDNIYWYPDGKVFVKAKLIRAGQNNEIKVLCI